MQLFWEGSEVLSGLTSWPNAKISKLLRSARSGRFNTLSLPGLTRTARRSPHSVDSQVEACSVLSDIGSVTGQPAVRSRCGGSAERRNRVDMLEAYVWPTLELFLTAWPERESKTRWETDCIRSQAHA
jgi:hypothetical protein